MRSAMGDRLEDICVSESQIQRGRQKWQKYYRLRNVNSANYNTKSRGGNRELKPRLINSGERARFVFVPLNSSLEERSRPLCCEIARARSAWLCCNRQETRYPKKVSKISEVREIAWKIYTLRFNESSPGTRGSLAHSRETNRNVNCSALSVRPRRASYIYRIYVYIVRSNSDPSSRRILVYWLIKKTLFRPTKYILIKVYFQRKNWQFS